MIGIVIKALFGLFVWWVLPSLLIKKKKSPWKRFVNVSCAIIGILIIAYAGYDMILMIIPH